MTAKERMELMNDAEMALKTLERALDVLGVKGDYESPLRLMATDIEYGWAYANNERVEEEKAWQVSSMR